MQCRFLRSESVHAETSIKASLACLSNREVVCHAPCGAATQGFNADNRWNASVHTRDEQTPLQPDSIHASSMLKGGVLVRRRRKSDTARPFKYGNGDADARGEHVSKARFAAISWRWRCGLPAAPGSMGPAPRAYASTGDVGHRYMNRGGPACSCSCRYCD